MTRVLIAGMGNVLRRDDGLGVEVVRRLTAEGGLPVGVRVVDVGIGGVHLVQELMAGYDALVVVDALDRGTPPGTVHVLEATVPDLAEWPEAARRDFLADTHYTTPGKALILARALGVLPPQAYLVGCQPADAESVDLGLSPIVERAAAETVAAVRRLVGTLCRVDCGPTDAGH